MKRTFRQYAAYVTLAGSLALGACTVQPPKEAHVRTETLTHAVAFQNNSTQMYPSEQDSLASFMSSIPANAVSYAGLAADDMNPRAVARARSIRNSLVKLGINPDTIHLQPTPGIDPLTVVLSVHYAKALPPEPCPDWSANSAQQYVDTNGSNFGCAYNNNLIVQLANPADYNGGHGTPSYDGARESVIVGRYMSGASSAAASSGSSSGATGGGGTTTTTTSSP